MMQRGKDGFLGSIKSVSGKGGKIFKLYEAKEHEKLITALKGMTFAQYSNTKESDSGLTVLQVACKDGDESLVRLLAE